MKREILFVAALLLLVTPVFATDVILTTTLNYPDAAMASVVANKIGAEVLFTEKDQLPTDVSNEISEINPDTIYIFGGPAVVSKDIEDELAETYDVVRLWGYTKYGTAVEVVKYFWPEGSDKAVVAWASRDRILSNESEVVDYAKNLAVAEEIPFLIAPYLALPSDVLDLLRELNVTQIYIVGDINGTVTSELIDIGITSVQSLNREQVQGRVREKIMSLTDKSLIVVVTDSWIGSLRAPVVTEGLVVHVNSEDDIQNAVDAAENGNFTKAKIVGTNDSLINKTAQELEDNGVNVTIVNFKYGVRYARAVRHIVIEKARRYLENNTVIKNYLTNLPRKVDDLLARINQTLQAMNISGQSIDKRLEKYEKLADEIINAYYGSIYMEAYRKYQILRSWTKRLDYNYRGDLGIFNYMVQSETAQRNKIESQIRSQIENLTVTSTDQTIVSRCEYYRQKALRELNKKHYLKARQYTEMAQRLCIDPKELKKQIEASVTNAVKRTSILKKLLNR